MFSSDPLAPVYLLAASVISVAFYAVHNAGMRAWIQQTFRDALTQAGASARAEIVKWAGVSTIGVLGVLTTGATANHLISMNYGPAVGLGTPGSTSPGMSAQASYTAPTTPTHDAVVFAATGDSLRIIGSAFSGSLDDTHDSTAIQVDTAGGDFSSPQYFNDTLGAVTTDTIPAIDSGAVVVSRIAYKGANGGWSAWSDSLSSTMAVSSFRANEPASMTQVADYDFCGTFAKALDGVGADDQSTVNGASPTLTITDWSHGEPIGPNGLGLDSFNVAGMYSAPCVHSQPYPDGMATNVGASTYDFSLGGTRTTVYVSLVMRYQDDGDGFEHNNGAEKILYFTGGANYWFGQLNGAVFGLEQIGADKVPTQDTVTVASQDGSFFEAELCLHAGSGDGQFRYWINGIEQASYTGLTFTGPSNMQVPSTYGGATSPTAKTGTEWRDIDHLYVSYGTTTCS